MQMVSTMAIKVTNGSLSHPRAHLLLPHSGAMLFCAAGACYLLLLFA
jgi:hypothetical protein